jgi:hypothetical protein
MAKNKDYGWASSSMWIAPDGSYGEGEVLFVDTKYWEDSDYTELDEASDSEKQDIALSITKFRRKQYRKMIELLVESKSIDVRTFIIDEDGVSEVDVDGNEK